MSEVFMSEVFIKIECNIEYEDIALLRNIALMEIKDIKNSLTYFKADLSDKILKEEEFISSLGTSAIPLDYFSYKKTTNIILNSFVVRLVSIVEKYIVEVAFLIYSYLEKEGNYKAPTDKEDKKERFTDTKSAMKSIEDNLNIKFQNELIWKIYQNIREKIRNKLAHGDLFFPLREDEIFDINKSFNIVQKYKPYGSDIIVKKRTKSEVGNIGFSLQEHTAFMHKLSYKSTYDCYAYTVVTDMDTIYASAVVKNEGGKKNKTYLCEITPNFDGFIKLTELFTDLISSYDLRINRELNNTLNDLALNQ